MTFVVDMSLDAVDRERRSFDAVPASARGARQFVREALRHHGATSKAISDYALAVSELATNIIEHGGGSPLVVCVDVSDPLWWEVEVTGGAPTGSYQVLQPETWNVASSERSSGRGLGIVRHLMDDIVAATADGQVSIRCRQRRSPAL